MSRVFPKIDPLAGIFAIFISLIWSSIIYLLFIQTPLVSKRELLFAGVIFIALITPVYYFLKKIIFPKLLSYTRQKIFILTLASILFGVFIAFNTYHPNLYLLYPNHRLTINIPAAVGQDAGKRVVAITWFHNGWGDVSFSQFGQTGSWTREPNKIFHAGGTPASLHWSGIIKDIPTIELEKSPNAGEIEVIWDGQTSTYNLTGTANERVTASTELNNYHESTLERLLYIFGFGAFFLFVTIALLEIRIQQPDELKRKRFFWLLYALPMIAVWGVFLLIFFPGLMSQDPIIQWQQVMTGQFVDIHPIFYALLIALLSKVYYSPAIMVIFNILVISLTLSWGFAELENMGVPRKVLWGLSALCAVLPVNIFMAISLRKDVPYSAAILLLSIIFLKLINSKGNWLKNRWGWLALGVVLGLIDLSRFNGIPVCLGSLVVFFVFFPHSRWRLIAAAGIFALMHFTMYGPIYTHLNVKHSSEYQIIPFLHYIAAHLDAGTPLDPAEADYLAQFAPLDGWTYSCCEVNPTLEAVYPGFIDQNYYLPFLKQDIQRPARTAIDLFLKDPLVDLRHITCTSQLVWSLNSTCPDFIITSLRGPSKSNSAPSNRFMTNLMGFVADSKIPKFMAIAYSYLQVFSDGIWHKLNYTPGIYLYLSIYLTAILAVRKKDWTFSLFLTPVIFQSVTLLFVTASQNFRYQYSVFLVAFICLGFMFAPVNDQD